MIATGPHPPGLAHYGAVFDACDSVGFLIELDIEPRMRRTPPNPPVLAGGYTSAALKIPGVNRYHTAPARSNPARNMGLGRTPATPPGLLFKGDTIEEAAVLALQHAPDDHNDAGVRKALAQAARDLGLR
jgi:hypothetical protein